MKLNTHINNIKHKANRTQEFSWGGTQVCTQHTQHSFSIQHRSSVQQCRTHIQTHKQARKNNTAAAGLITNTTYIPGIKTRPIYTWGPSQYAHKHSLTTMYKITQWNRHKQTIILTPLTQLIQETPTTSILVQTPSNTFATRTDSIYTKYMQTKQTPSINLHEHISVPMHKILRLSYHLPFYFPSN